MFIETDNGYEEYNNTTFPSNYIINLDSSISKSLLTSISNFLAYLIILLINLLKIYP